MEIIPASQAFKDDCHTKGQKISFSGSGAYHQNGVTECSIQTVVGWARTMLLHAAIHWPEVAELQLWQFTLYHAFYLYYAHLQCIHVWGCPSFS
jgi:hypothetical protein